MICDFNMAGHVDASQIFFTNLLLLDFDPAAVEKKCKIPFNKDMFALPNKALFEIVMYFLFDRLNATKCKEVFRDCWPVFDKKREQQFRRCCHSWLSEIVQEDSDAVLPRIVPSVFMSPAGNKIVELLMYFSTYVLLKISQNDHCLKRKDFIQHPFISSQTQSTELPKVMLSVMRCSSIRLRKKFLSHAKQTCAVQDKWREYAVEQVKKYRNLNKAHREKERELRSELSQMSQQGTLSGSPLAMRRKSGSQYDYDIQSVKRAQKVQKVRDLWHSLDDFLSSSEKHKQVIESLLDGSLDKTKIDASDLNVKIPDLLLRQCEQEMHRRGVENIYLGGKLNLLSLIHLWNLSLHLYIDKLNRAGLPNFEEPLQRMTSEVNSHHLSLNDFKALRLRLEREVIPQMKESIKLMKARLEDESMKNKSPDSLRTTSLGFGLLPQTPPVHFEPDDTGTPGVNFRITLSPEDVSTPDGVAELISEIGQRVRSRQNRLIQQDSLPSFHRTQSRVWIKDSSGYDFTDTEKTAPKQFISTSEAKINKQPVGKTGILQQGSKGLPTTDRHATSNIRGKTRRQDIRTTDNKQIRAPTRKPTTNRPSKIPGCSSTELPVNPKQTRTTEDILANEIAEAVIGLSLKSDSQAMIDSSPENDSQGRDQDPVRCLLSKDSDAFCTVDKLSHTPPRTGHKQWHDSLLHDSIGPLSSTRMDQSAKINIDKRSIDPTATKLFTQGGSDYLDSTQTEMSDKIISMKMSPKLSHHRPDLDRIRAVSPLGENLPSSISSISPHSDRSSTKTLDKRQSTLINEIEHDGEQEHTLESSRNNLEGDVGARSDIHHQTVDECVKRECVGSSVDQVRIKSWCDAKTLSVSAEHGNDNGQSSSDLEESVRVIQFQNGSFNEFLDKSPAKSVNQAISNTRQSPSKSQLQAMKEHLDKTTDSLLSQCQQLAEKIQSPQRKTVQTERFLTENELLRGGARPKPLPLIAQTPTMSFLDSYMNCSPPPGKYGNIMPTDDSSRSWIVNKLNLDWGDDDGDGDDDDDDHHHHTDDQKGLVLGSSSAGHVSHQDEIHKHLTILSPKSALKAPSEVNQPPAESVGFDFGLSGQESGLMEEMPLFFSDELECSLNKSDSDSASRCVESFNLSAIPRSPYSEKSRKVDHKSELLTGLFGEDSLCLIQESPSVPSERVGKLIDI